MFQSVERVFHRCLFFQYSFGFLRFQVIFSNFSPMFSHLISGPRTELTKVLLLKCAFTKKYFGVQTADILPLWIIPFKFHTFPPGPTVTCQSRIHKSFPTLVDTSIDRWDVSFKMSYHLKNLCTNWSHPATLYILHIDSGTNFHISEQNSQRLT